MNQSSNSATKKKKKKNTVATVPCRTSLVNGQQSLIQRSSHRSNLFSSSSSAAAAAAAQQRRRERSICPMESSSIRLALRSSSSYQIDEKQRIYFDEIFSKTESTLSIAEKIADQCLRQEKKKTLILLSGQYREIQSLQTHLISRLLTELFHLGQDQSWNLFYSYEDFSLDPTTIEQIHCHSPSETTLHLTNLHSEHRSHPFLVTFSLRSRSSNHLYLQYQLLSTHDHDARFAHLFLSWLLTSTVKFSPSKSSLRSTFFDEYFREQSKSDRFAYLISSVKHGKHVKLWTKVSRALRMDRKSRHRHRQQEIWIDGPFSSPSSSSEIWIDGPPIISSRKKSPLKTTRSHSSKPSTFSPPLSSTLLNENAAETDSIISSHCHLPVLPVFKDHSLLPFRSTLPRKNDTTESSASKWNEEMENLEKALESFVVRTQTPAALKNDESSSKVNSFNRIDQLSSCMSHEEKNKRLSRILSPTRFDQLLMHSSSLDPNCGSSVPGSPRLSTRTTAHPIHSTPHPPPHPPSSTATTTTSTRLHPKKSSRPSLFERLFGFRSGSTMIESSSTPSPLITPLTVTWDSPDDLMPLTTSSAASSASGRASSSGYESLSNTAFDEVMHSYAEKPRSSRRTRDKTVWTSPMMKKRLHRQQRLSQLKLELALTKSHLLKSTIEHQEALQPYLTSSSYRDGEDDDDDEEEIEREIEHLERRLRAAKNHLIFVSCQKK